MTFYQNGSSEFILNIKGELQVCKWYGFAPYFPWLCLLLPWSRQVFETDLLEIKLFTAQFSTHAKVSEKVTLNRHGCELPTRECKYSAGGHFTSPCDGPNIVDNPICQLMYSPVLIFQYKPDVRLSWPNRARRLGLADLII